MPRAGASGRNLGCMRAFAKSLICVSSFLRTRRFGSCLVPPLVAIIRCNSMQVKDSWRQIGGLGSFRLRAHPDLSYLRDCQNWLCFVDWCRVRRGSDRLLWSLGSFRRFGRRLAPLSENSRQTLPRAPLGSFRRAAPDTSWQRPGFVSRPLQQAHGAIQRGVQAHRVGATGPCSLAPRAAGRPDCTDSTWPVTQWPRLFTPTAGLPKIPGGTTARS
jgi:hypothetical protein